MRIPPVNEEKNCWDGVGDLRYHDSGADKGVECYYLYVRPYVEDHRRSKRLGLPVVEQT